MSSPPRYLNLAAFQADYLMYSLMDKFPQYQFTRAVDGSYITKIDGPTTTVIGVKFGHDENGDSIFISGSETIKGGTDEALAFLINLIKN